MKLTKRLLSMLLVVCMVFTLLPTVALTASAADYTGTGTFTQCTGALTSGYYVLGGGSTTSVSAINNTVGASWIKYTATTVSSGTITNPDTSIVWYYDASAGTFMNGSNYIYWPTSGNTGGVGTSSTPLTVTETGTSGVYNVTVTATPSRYLRLNGTSGYRFYTSSTGSADFYFYKLEDGGSTTKTYNVNLNQTTGGTISATPASAAEGATVTLSYTLDSGYSFGEWTVLDGESNEVTVTDNTFTMPASDVEVEATFNEVVLNNYTVTYHYAGGTTSTATVTEGNAIGTLPEITAPDGWVAIGWSTAEIPAAQETAPTLYTGTAAVTGNLDLYAVYAQENTGEETGYKLVDTPTAGKTYLVVTSDETGTAYALDASKLTTTSAKTVSATEVTITESGTDKYISTTDTNLLWTFSGSTSSAQFRSNNDDGYYLKINGSGFAGSATSTNVYWNTSYGLYGKSSSGSTSYYVQPSGTTSLSASSTSGSATSRVYLYEGGAAAASYSNYTTNPGTMYTITWMANGETYATNVLAADSEVTAPAENPTMDDTAAEYFDFAGWSATDGGAVLDSFPNATENATYYAVFTTHTFCTVEWVVDGTTVATETYRAGETPVYPNGTPTKESDGTNKYTFTGWDPEVTTTTEGATVTYTAVFEATEIVYAASLSLSSTSVKAGRSATATATLTADGAPVTDLFPTYSSSNTTVATVDASTGKISALTVGTTDITATYTVNGETYTATVTLTVVENTSSGGYTLITQDNVPTDWSGDYIIMGKIGSDTDYMNTWMLLTPDYDTGTVKIAENNKDAATITITDDGSGVGTGTINDEGNASSGVDKTIVMEDTGLVTDTDGNDVLVYDTISEIDDSYAFTIECIDDINQIYTIRVKDTDLYIACSASQTTGSNSLNFSSSATELAQWQFSVQRVTKGGYNNDIITAQNVGNTTRRLYFNSNQYGAINGQFRDYHYGAYGSLIGGNDNGQGQTYNLYLFGNPNPFKAQIYYHGEQITLVETGKINANAATAQLTGALTPDIDGYANWTMVGDPVWEIVENSTGNNMTIDSATGLITTNASTVGSYALVKVTYTIHDEINNVNHLVSTTAKVEIVDADATYSTVIYETYSGMDTEVQYTVPNSMTTLPLAAYVVNDSTDDNSKTGSVVMGGTLSWSATISSGGGTNASASISADGVLTMANFASDAIITVTVSGATGDTVAASSATYKVYVKTAEYTLTVVPTTDSEGTFDSASDVLTVASGESSAHLTYNVVDDNGNGPSSTTFTLAGYAWTLSGDTYGATINSSGYLSFDAMDRSEDHTITAVVSRVAATDVTTGVTKSNLTDTITIVVKARTVEETLEAVDDTVIIDWALPVTFNVLTNDNYNVAVTVTAGTLPTGVSANGDGSFTYTPSDWQTTDQTFTYTLSGTVDGVATTSSATVTLKTADSIYYEETYSDIFTFTGDWTDVTDGTPVAEQTSSLDTADIFEYDANHAEYAMYSGGTAKMTTLTKGANASVQFTFAGTGFDIISATTNNTGAIMLTVKDASGSVVTDPNTGRKLSQILDIYRGYTYVEGGYTRYGLKEVARYALVGESYIPDDAGSYYYDSELGQFVENTTWYTGETDKFYDSVEALAEYIDENGTCIVTEYTSYWQPCVAAEGGTESYNANFYQIPVLKVTDLTYGTYTVTVKPVYSAAYDRQGDGSYDFIFDGVRIHNPVAGRAAEYKYISLSDAVKEAGFGSGTVVACDHVGYEWSDWTFYSRARNTTSEATCNRGSFVQYCENCGGVANTAYFHVNITADDTELGVGGYNGLPATTMLHYTLTADECGDATIQASIQAKLDAITGTLTEYWSSNTRDIMTCMNNANVVIANGAGTTYATLQLKDPATQTIYASAIHSPMITVSADETHTHTFGDWVHDADSSPSTHTHTCTADTCSYFETEECVFTAAVTTEPTQTEEGVMTYTCTGCGYSYTESIPATGGYTATFHVPDGATAPEALTGNSVTMPAAVEAPAAYDAHSYTFIGWLGNSLSDTTDEQTFYAAGETVTLTADTDFYALYTYAVAGEGTGSQWELVTDLSTVTAGTYALLTQNYYAFTGTINSSGHGVATSTAFVFTDGIADSAPSGTLRLTLTSSGSGYTVYNADNGYLYIKAASSGNLAWSNTATSAWTFSDNMYYSGVTNARLRAYNDSSFRSYGANNGQIMQLAKLVGSSATYFTTILQAACTHANTTYETVDATCTTAGYIKEICSDCGAVVDYVEVEATGHSYGSATNTGDAAQHTYTCTVCGDSYTEDHSFTTSVSGDTTTYTCTLCGYTYDETESYTLTYVVPESQTAPSAATGTSATLPGMDGYTSGSTTYTFVGWAATPVTATTTAPTLYAAGDTYTFSADTKLYACYSYDVTSGGSDTYTLTSDLTDGDYMIGAIVGSAGTDNVIAAMNATANTWLKYEKFTPASGVITNSDSQYVWTLTNADSGFTLLNKSTNQYLVLGSGTGSSTVSVGSTGTTIYTSVVDSALSTFEVHQSSTATASSGNQLSCNLGTGYGYRMYANRTHETTATGISTQIRFFKAASSGTGTTTTYYTTDDAATTTTVTYTVGLTADTTKIDVGGEAVLEATLYADGVAVSGAVPEWSNSQSSVATIETADEICMVTGVANGTTQVRATFSCPDGTTKYSYKTITVGSTSTSGPSSAEEVNYVTSGSYIYNWGTRGTTATFLTTYATDYYTGSYSYDTLAALSGSSSTSASDIYNSALGQAIHSMLAAKQSFTTTYDGTRSLFCYTDCEESNTSKISSYYSGTEVSGTWDSGATWNREHTWPNSKGLNGNDEADIMMLRPTSVSENSSRGNTAYGESSGYYDPNSVSSSALNLHGDVARLMLQHMMRWGNTDNMFGSSGVMESRAVLLKWMEEDPVDTWEMGRNDAVQAITGVRNVFVDYPELGFLLLGADIPEGYTTPSSATKSAVAAVSAEEVSNAERTATRSIPTGDFTGAVIIDGMGQSNVADDFATYGPDYGVYLAPGQGIVFSLASDVTTITAQDLQIGAKAVNGTATQMDVAAISNGVKYLLQNQAIASATEMYYELDGSQVSWTNGNSSIIVIYNSGSGVLDVTNLRYSTANGNTLTLTINDTQATAAVKMLSIVYGTAATIADPNEDAPATEPETPAVPELPDDPLTPSDSETPADPEPEVKVEQFKDISESDWFYEGVKYAVESGLMVGVSEEDFAPDDTLTRAMLVTILYRLAGNPAVDENAELAFTDVEDDQWYTDAIIWATEEGITHGTTETTFGTEDPVTREQMVTFLWRYVGEPTSEQSLESFPDADRISAFAVTAMRWAVENGIVAGNEMGGKIYIDPLGNATRAQIAVIFMRSEKTLALSE